MSRQPDAGVVDEDVQPAEPLDGLAYCPRRIGRVPGISAHCQDRIRWERSRGGSRCFCSRPVIATLAPRPMSAPAIASPIPREPPVTTATVEASRAWEVHLGGRLPCPLE